MLARHALNWSRGQLHNLRRLHRRPPLALAIVCLATSLSAVAMSSTETQARLHERIPTVILRMKGKEPIPPVFATGGTREVTAPSTALADSR